MAIEPTNGSDRDGRRCGTRRRAGRWAAALCTVLLAAEAAAHGIAPSAPLVGRADRPHWMKLIPSARGAARMQMEEAGGFRLIEADGLPDHATGQFPNRRNPNAVRAQRYELRVPLRPVKAGRITPLVRAPFGIALNGVLFDPGTAEFWNRDPASGWNHEALSGHLDLGLDSSNAHVQPNGAYHYHGLPVALAARLGYRSRPVLLGYAADGFPIYGPFGHRDPADARSPLVELESGYRLKAGTRPSGPGGPYDGTFVEDYEYAGGGLDACNGRDGVTPEYPSGTYHYVITLRFPFVPRCFAGTPDGSFARRGPKPPPPGPAPFAR